MWVLTVSSSTVSSCKLCKSAALFMFLNNLILSSGSFIDNTWMHDDTQKLPSWQVISSDLLKLSNRLNAQSLRGVLEGGVVDFISYYIFIYFVSLACCIQSAEVWRRHLWNAPEAWSWVFMKQMICSIIRVSTVFIIL